MTLIEAFLLLFLIASAVAGSVLLGSAFGVVGYVLGIRLRALAEAPYAFSTTHAMAAQWSADR